MAAAMKEKSSRQTKTTKEQYEIYVAFLECNREMACKKDCDNSVQKLWQELTQLLNSGAGPNRTTQCWKKIFENWRNAVRHKSRKVFTHLSGTGGGPEYKDKLKDLEERALNVWGKIVVAGIGDVEAGFNDVAPDTPPVNLVPAELQNVPQEAPRPRGKRKNDDELLLSRLNQIEAKQAEGFSEIAEGLQSIADSINNLAEVIHMALKKN